VLGLSVLGLAVFGFSVLVVSAFAASTLSREQPPESIRATPSPRETSLRRKSVSIVLGPKKVGCLVLLDGLKEIFVLKHR
jgi:hypothetical protein